VRVWDVKLWASSVVRWVGGRVGVGGREAYAVISALSFGSVKWASKSHCSFVWAR